MMSIWITVSVLVWMVASTTARKDTGSDFAELTLPDGACLSDAGLFDLTEEQCIEAVASLVEGATLLQNGRDYGDSWPHGCFNRGDGAFFYNTGGTAGIHTRSLHNPVRVCGVEAYDDADEAEAEAEAIASASQAAAEQKIDAETAPASNGDKGSKGGKKGKGGKVVEKDGGKSSSKADAASVQDDHAADADGGGDGIGGDLTITLLNKAGGEASGGSGSGDEVVVADDSGSGKDALEAETKITDEGDDDGASRTPTDGENVAAAAGGAQRGKGKKGAEKGKKAATSAAHVADLEDDAGGGNDLVITVLTKDDAAAKGNAKGPKKKSKTDQKAEGLTSSQSIHLRGVGKVSANPATVMGVAFIVGAICAAVLVLAVQAVNMAAKKKAAGDGFKLGHMQSSSGPWQRDLLSEKHALLGSELTKHAQQLML